MSNKNKYDQFNLLPVGPNLCDFYGQYIGFGGGGGGASGVSLTSVGNSALFSAVTQNLSRSQGSGSNTVWTFSSWIYKCESKNQVFLQSGGSPAGQLGWDTSDRLYIYNGATVVALTTQVFRDIGWYHIHIAYNTSASGTAKVKLSVNGSLVSVFTTDNRSGAGAFNGMNQNGQTLTLGNNGSVSDTICLSGYMAETVILDGTAAEPTSFGAYDSSGLFWTPLDSETMIALADAGGTNSFYLDNSNSTFDSAASFTDRSSTAHALTAGGNVTHSTAVTKVNATSIKFDGSGDHLKWAQGGHADFTLGTGDWCIEGWFYRIAHSGTSNYSYIIDFRYSGNNSDRPAIYMATNNNIQFDINGTKINSSTDPSMGAWFHLAVAKYSGTTTMYLNGTSVGTYSDSVDYLVGRPWLGDYPQVNSYCINGYMDEVRISKGNARYTGNFTPSTTAHVADSDTVFLLSGVRTYGAGTDASSKSNHLVNSGATTTTHTPTNMFNT